jgi:hypothetical protein
MTRVFALALLLIMSTVIFVGCQSGTETKSTTPANTTEKKADDKKAE